jgi:hypothetical protein
MVAKPRLMLHVHCLSCFICNTHISCCHTTNALTLKTEILYLKENVTLLYYLTTKSGVRHTHAPERHTNMSMLQKTEVEGTALTKLGDIMLITLRRNTYHNEMATKQQSFICALINRKNTALFS